MIPEFPVIAQTIYKSSESDGAVVAMWKSRALPDGSKAMLIFDSQIAFDEYNQTEMLIGARITNAGQFFNTLREAKSHGISKICWNMRGDGTCDKCEPIASYLQ